MVSKLAILRIMSPETKKNVQTVQERKSTVSQFHKEVVDKVFRK